MPTHTMATGVVAMLVGDSVFRCFVSDVWKLGGLVSRCSSTLSALFRGRSRSKVSWSVHKAEGRASLMPSFSDSHYQIKQRLLAQDKCI